MLRLVAAVGVALLPSVSAAQTAFDFTFDGITGEPMPLAEYAGNALLITNTASRCGFTGQYENLQTVWERYRDRGLIVIGVPSDDFNQELATEAEVRAFCEVNFGIDFPMTAITRVTGADAHPFFQWVEDQGADQPSWNFKEYLIAPDGRLVAEFSTRAEATDDAVIAAIEAVLPDR